MRGQRGLQTAENSISGRWMAQILIKVWQMEIGIERSQVGGQRDKRPEVNSREM